MAVFLSFLTGITAIAGISAIAAMTMIFGTGWIVGTQFVNLDRKLEGLGLPDPKKFSECTSKYSTSDCTMYTELIKNIEATRKENQPIVITCCAIAIVVGFLQLTISLLILFSDPKNTRKRTRLWMTSHFVFLLVLLVTILSAYLTQYHNGVDGGSSSEDADGLEKTLKKMEPSQDFGQLSTFLTLASPLFYSVVGTDFVATLILFCVGVYVLHKYNDYDTQE